MNEEHFENTFIEEATELLEDLEEALLLLEETPHDADLVQRVFRAMHTIKGAAGMFGFAEISTFTHEIESAYEMVRSGNLDISKSLIDITLQSLDVIRAMLEGQTDASLENRAITSVLQQIRADGNDAATAQPMPQPEPVASNQQSEPNMQYLRILFFPHPNLLMNGTNVTILFEELRELGECIIQANTEKIPDLEAIDPVSCYTYWDILLRTTEPIETVRSVFVFVEEDCELKIETEEAHSKPAQPSISVNDIINWDLPASKFLSSEEDLEILHDFIYESQEGLERAEHILMEWESTGRSEPLTAAEIDSLFRCFHSIKGSAAFLELFSIVTITHEVENFLDSIRKTEIEFSHDHVLGFIKLIDFFKLYLTALKNHESISRFEADEEYYVQLFQNLRDLPDLSPDPEDDDLPEDTAETASQHSESEQHVVTNESFITPEMRKQFVIESRELLEEIESGLLELETDPGDRELASGAFRAVHSIKGNAGLFGCHDIAIVCHHIENFLDMVRSREIVATEQHFSFLLQVLDFVRIGLDNFEYDDKNVIDGISGIIGLIEEGLGKPATGETPAPQPILNAEVLSQNEDEKIVPASDATPQINAIKTSQPVPPVAAAPAEKSPQSRPVFAEKQSATPMANVATATANKVKQEVAVSAVPKTKPATSGVAKTGSEVIRVDVAKLNELMDLVGEIVIAESMVAQHPEIVGRDLPGFEKAVMHLQKNIRSLQEMATAMRMIPLAGLFKRMIRLVRDVSNKVGKSVNLEILGGETEVDRTVIETISDPLVHIIRNSIDHGIEMPDERRKNGKKPAGKVVLEAKQVGSEILIYIRDDGHGLNRTRILTKARERGLISGNDADMPDSSVWPLIFKPGFSTAEKLTDLSGRGVGMDVVLKNIESIRGRVDVESESGKGTTIILRIPLTTAIVDGMQMRVGDAIYALPMMDIRESLQITPENIVTLINGEEMVKIRHNLYPVLRIHELHNIKNSCRKLNEGLVVLAESSGKSVCLFVDELIGQKQLVIKPLPEYSGNVRGVSGCTILGDGDICLILDVANLIKYVHGSD